jgi:hypothetical protein
MVLGFGNTPECHQTPGVQLNLDLVLGIAHLHAPTDPVERYRVAVTVERDIASFSTSRC